MDKIYSRKRIKLPKLKWLDTNIVKKMELKNEKKFLYKSKKIIKIFCIIFIAIFVFVNSLKQIEPILEKECLNIAKNIATEISNKQVSGVMSEYKYDDLCSILKDENENVKMIKSNTININEITSKVTIRIQKELNKLNGGEINTRLGNFTGSKFLAGRGPKVYFKISKLGNVETSLKSEFVSAGINQTMHKIYLQIECNIVIITPFNQVEGKNINQVLIAEAVILGNIPSSYYNIEGVKQDNLIDIVQ